MTKVRDMIFDWTLIVDLVDHHHMKHIRKKTRDHEDRDRNEKDDFSHTHLWILCGLTGERSLIPSEGRPTAQIQAEPR